jgi:hypothetical protein
MADPRFVDVLADLDGLLNDPKCRIVKDERKIKVARITVSIAGEIRSLYLKRYNAFSLRYKLLSPFFRSGALRALNGASVLREVGIASATPLAGVEDRVFGILQRSFFVTEEIAGAKTVDAYWVEDLRNRQGRAGFKGRRLFLSELAALFHTLHARRTYHNDLKDANIMALPGDKSETTKFFLLDLEGVRRCHHLSRRRKVKNLIQIYRTLGRFLSRSQQLFFLKHYMKVPPVSRKAVRDLSERVINRTRRLDAWKARRRERA